MVHLLTILVFITSVMCDTDSDLPKVRNRRLVGGSPSKPGSHSFMASLRYYDKHICGSTIYSRDYILTAAHCIIGKWYKKLSVRVGSANRNAGGYIHKVAKIAYPQNLAILMNQYDIALLKLETSINFEALDNVSAVELFGSNEPVFEGTKVILLGWGSSQSNGMALSDELHEVSVRTISNDECAVQQGLNPDFLLDTICTIGIDKGGNNGDSGGPLLINGRQAGVMARGNCAPPFLQLNTRISFLHDWLEESVKELDDTQRPSLIKYPVDVNELWYNQYNQGEVMSMRKASFLVAILNTRNEFICSGSIIGPVHVLTSASCAKQIEKLPHVVRAGVSTLKSGGWLHDIVGICPHPEYQLNEHNKPINDLALIEVLERFSSSLEIILLFPGESFDTVATVYGWGQVYSPMREAGEEEFVLKSLVVAAQSGNKECGILTEEISETGGQFCSSTQNDEGACISNVGGPLVIDNYLIGVVSWVYEDCGDYWYPTIYSKIASHRNWIHNEVNIQKSVSMRHMVEPYAQCPTMYHRT
ncbi:hypothetical protein QAD02_003895 [Eretmocerus hayati]|uniref:Uncharacterized protein n=1 Tax=Eretmocerus hayati TaxID=131215 RepID=A0ACC2NNC0_9HYME|nr:hypothetical protein QAD02_003895 [Eretmocerus hayati]